MRDAVTNGTCAGDGCHGPTLLCARCRGFGGSRVILNPSASNAVVRAGLRIVNSEASSGPFFRRREGSPKADCWRRSLAPLEKTRGFGKTPANRLRLSAHGEHRAGGVRDDLVHDRPGQMGCAFAGTRAQHDQIGFALGGGVNNGLRGRTELDHHIGHIRQ
jgi:hypothetical protein